MPQYLISMSPTKVVLRNYEGVIATYVEPQYIDEGWQSEGEQAGRVPGRGGLLESMEGAGDRAGPLGKGAAGSRSQHLRRGEERGMQRRMNMREVVIVKALRTAIGSFGGTLKGPHCSAAGCSGDKADPGRDEPAAGRDR